MSHNPFLSRRLGVFLGAEIAPRSFGFGFRPSYQELANSSIFYQGDGHLLASAPTGAGKGIGVIIPNLILNTDSIINTDPKGENYLVTANRRRMMGQKVVVLDPFHHVHSQPDAFNPFDLFKLPGVDIETEAETLAHQLGADHSFSTDRFWDDTGKGLVAGITAHIATTAEPAKRNLVELCNWLFDGEIDHRIAVALDEDKVKSPLARREFISYLTAPSDRTRPCILTTAQTYVKCLSSEQIQASLTRTTFDLNALLRGEPMTIYIIIPPTKLDSHRSLLRLTVGTLLSVVLNRKKMPKTRTLFLLDEAAQLGKLPQLRSAITLQRGYGLQVFSFWQDMAQLRELYPTDWPSLINNSAVLQAFAPNNFLAAKDWAEYMGVPPYELFALPRDQGVIHSSEWGTKYFRRANYLSDSIFQDLFDPNTRFDNYGGGHDVK